VRSNDDGMVAAVVVTVLTMLILVAGQSYGLGRQSGHYDILSQAQKQGVLTITVDPLTLERTYVWHPPVERTP